MKPYIYSLPPRHRRGAISWQAVIVYSATVIAGFLMLIGGAVVVTALLN